MSQTITNVDLSLAIVGTSGKINFPTVTSDKGYTFVVFNESGCGLHIQFLTSTFTDKIPAGGWRKFTLTPGEEGMTWLVEYVLPSPKVSLLIGTLYAPGEKIPEIGILGNSPIGGLVLQLKSVTVNGNTSGSITIYQFVQGALILTYGVLNAFFATSQNISLPMAYTGVSFINMVDILSLQTLLAGIVKNVTVITALQAAFPGGSGVSQNIIYSASFGWTPDVGFDSITVDTGGAAISGIGFIIEGQ